MRPGWITNMAALAVAGTGAGYATQPLWSTGGQAPSEAMPLVGDVVPSRAQQLARMHESSPDKPFDILIIGGGATGAGCALDAATRGLRTALVEREDWASGTSSKSTKLVHGGVRYLEKAVKQLDYSQLKLVYEALHERKTLLSNAPHLTHALPIVTPCYKWWEVPYYWAGMKMYDLLAGRTNLIISKYMSPTETLSVIPTLAPALKGSDLKGSIVYYDGQFDDARLNVALACSAAAAGAAALNYMECTSLIKNQSGQVVGAKVRDVATGEQLDVYARLVINATGPFLDGVRKLSDGSADPTLATSLGAHVTLPAYLASNTTGIIIPKTPDGRVVFLLPFQGHLIAGTTDHKCEVTNTPRTSSSDVAFILSTISDYLGVPVSTSDVLSTWSGIRPLPAINPRAKDKQTENIVRDHVIFMDDDGLLNVSGGKWTTYRRMAEDAINTAVASGRLPMNARACATHDLKLIGARAYRRTLHAEVAQQYCNPATTGTGSGTESLNAQAVVASRSPVVPHIDLDTANHLVNAYGDRAHSVLSLAAESGLTGRLVEGHPYLEAEVLYCTQAEYCMTVQDFIARRSRLAFLDVHACQAALPRIASIMGKALGWSKEQQQQQVQAATAFLLTCFTAGGPDPAGSGVVPQVKSAGTTSPAVADKMKDAGRKSSGASAPPAA